MPLAALVIYVVVGVLVSGGRVWLHYRRTGDFGVRLSGRAGPRAVLALVLAGVGIVATLLALAGGLLGMEFGRPMFASALGHGAGLGLIIAGGIVTVAAQFNMGASWRAGVDPSETTELVTSGLFRVVRNPIFTGALLLQAGLVLAVPNMPAFVALAASIAAIELHVRAVEEPYLLRVHGERYRSYANRVGRFVPGIGLDRVKSLP